MILLALFLVWDVPLDIDDNPVDPALIKEYIVYIDGEEKARVPSTEVAIEGLGWGNKKVATVAAVATTGEVSPQSDPLTRVQLKNGGSNKRVESR
jgi:hypothetical protein